MRIDQLTQLERAATLLDPTRFAARAVALDWLDSITGAPPESGTRASARYQRALALQTQLEAINTQLFHNLRQQLASTPHTPQQVHQLFSTYINLEWRDYRTPDERYDELDQFFAGLFTIGAAPAPTLPDEPEMVGYQPTPKRLILELIEHVGLPLTSTQAALQPELSTTTPTSVCSVASVAQGSPHHRFVDLGAGLGHVVLLVALLGGVAARGIELQPGYCAAARHCATALGVHQASFVQSDARTASLAWGNLFYLYTPFRGALLAAVLARLKAEAGQRPIRVCSYGPCSQVVARQPWLRAEAGLPPGSTLRLFSSR